MAGLSAAGHRQGAVCKMQISNLHLQVFCAHPCHPGSRRVGYRDIRHIKLKSELATMQPFPVHSRSEQS